MDDNSESDTHGAAYCSAPNVTALLASHEAYIRVWNRASEYRWTPC